MKLATKRTLFWLAGLALLASALVLFDLSVVMVWQGRGELEIGFQVVDGATGQPIPTATIFVRTDEIDVVQQGRGRNKRVELAVDAEGKSEPTKHNVSTGGRSGRLGFFDTAGPAVPSWSVRAEAPGYQTCDAIDLYTASKAQRVDAKSYRLFVQIPLKAAELAP